MITLADLTPEQIAVLCNGCGPSGWKRHGWKWKLAQWLTPRLRIACQRHDLAYVVGGTDEERNQADRDFREEIADVASESGWIVGWLLEQEQPILYGLVDSQGDEHWHRPRRTLAQVIELADKRIREGA